MTLLKRRPYLLLLVIFIAQPSFAQRRTDNLELKTPDGRTVILKSDGTWEYKKETVTPKPAVPVSAAALETLSPNFAGDDPTTLLRQLVDLKKRLVKSEFETSAAYEARVAEEKKKPILGSRSAEDTFYLVSSAVNAEYNADSQFMSFTLPVEKNVLAGMIRRGLSEDRATVTNLERISLYTISLGSYNDPKVFFNDPNGLPLSGSSYDPQFSAKVNLNVDEARRIKTGAKAILTVRFEEPFAVTRYISDGGQFQVRLLDVQFFDQQTGKILAKLGSTVTPATTSPTPKKNAHVEKAKELYDSRRDEEALAELRQALTDEPTNAEAFLLTGRINLQRGDQEAAIAALKAALFWNAQLIDAHILLARIFLARGDQRQANKYVNSALALEPSNQEALTLRRQIPR